MGHIAFLLDAPTVPAGDGTVRSQHPVARLGKYKDPRYGTFGITRSNYEDWVRNMAALQGGRIPIDYDHAADRPGGSSEAAGWITGLSLQTGAQIKTTDPEQWKALDPTATYAVADIEWTPDGAQAVREKRWLFVSPSIDDHYTNEQDEDCGSALVGVALTNRPFLRRGMPTINLSRDDGERFAEAVGERADSPDDMPDLTKIAAALKLDKDADEATILAAATKLIERPEADKLTLAQRAEAEGKVLLDKSEHDTLQAASEKLPDTLKRLEKIEGERKDEKFELAYTAAFDGGRVDAKDETKAGWKELYAAAPEPALKQLAALPKLVNTEARGHGGGNDADVNAPTGGDVERFELHQKAKAYQAEHKTDYVTALSAVAEQEAAA